MPDVYSRQKNIALNVNKDFFLILEVSILRNEAINDWSNITSNFVHNLASFLLFCEVSSYFISPAVDIF